MTGHNKNIPFCMSWRSSATVLSQQSTRCECMQGRTTVTLHDPCDGLDYKTSSFMARDASLHKISSQSPGGLKKWEHVKRAERQANTRGHMTSNSHVKNTNNGSIPFGAAVNHSTGCTCTYQSHTSGSCSIKMGCCCFLWAFLSCQMSAV